MPRPVHPEGVQGKLSVAASLLVLGRVIPFISLRQCEAVQEFRVSVSVVNFHRLGSVVMAYNKFSSCAE